MSWLKKRFSRLRRLAGLKPKNKASKAAASANDSPNAELEAALTSAEKDADSPSAPEVSTSQLTLEISGDNTGVALSKETACDGEPEEAVSASSVQDVPKVNNSCRLPVKVRTGSLRDKEKTTTGDNNNVVVAQKNQRWASQAGKAAPVKRPPGKLPRLDRVRPTAAPAPAQSDEDSRVHSAMVSKVNPAARSVTVEWYERGETKGKEVELDAILQLNAELAQSEAAASQPKITKQSSAGGGGGSSGALEAGGHQHQMSANPLSRKNQHKQNKQTHSQATLVHAPLPTTAAAADRYDVAGGGGGYYDDDDVDVNVGVEDQDPDDEQQDDVVDDDNDDDEEDLSADGGPTSSNDGGSAATATSAATTSALSGGGTLPIRPTLSARSNPTQGAIRSGISKLAQTTLNGHRTTRQSMAADQIENIPPTVQRSRLQPPSSRLSMPAVNNNNHNNQLNTTSAAAAALAAAQAQAQQAAAAAAAQAAAAQAAAAAAAASAPPITQPPAGGQAGRRSYVVKEVERLKENREKRRARQAEIKEEKVALMNMDPGNPNWELAAMIREFQSLIDFRPLADGAPIEDHQITVCVRKRPVSRKELMKKELDVICVPTKDQLIVHEPKTKVDLTKFLENHKFRFDYSFDDSCTNEMVYKYTAKPLVNTIFEGGMATCFAYGQTGSGKTHTMGGQFNGKQQDCKNGIYALAAHDVFAQLNGKRYRHLNLVVSTSFFEIYSGKVFDLLSDKQKLRVLEDGKQQVQVVGLTEKVVDSVDEVLKIIQHGNATRTSGQTSANANSSRSHAVFQIVLRPPGSSRIHGKFSFIDLAGNERGADTSSANRQTRMEGAEINKSLLALKECIRALGKQSAHLPFRVSKLTQVLRDSFIGEKSKTCMIAMISPGLMSVEHTLNTLRYANRVKELVVPAEGGGADGAGGGMAAGGRGAGDDEDDELLEDMMESDDQKNGSGGNNGDHLRSLSEHEMSDDVLNQHAAISDLQQTEEILVDQHKAMNEFLAQFLPESQKLHTTTNYVEYDQDSYCKRGEELFTQLAELATDCRDLMAQFRNKLANEELLSYNVNGHPAGKR